MFKKIIYLILLLVCVPIISVNATEIGKSAPNFVAIDIHGDEFNLKNYKGKIVVLEWTNHLCPFVRKHYESGNMQYVQKTATDQGITWVSIVSSAEGKQGAVSAAEAIEIEKQAGANSTTRILDPSGEIGKLYDAKTTPHMFIISKDGTLVYKGAIDDRPNPHSKSLEGATNFVLSAINNLTANEEVEIPHTPPYGCAVKY